MRRLTNGRRGLMATATAALIAVTALSGCGQSEAEKRAEARAKYAQAVNDVQDKHGAKLGSLTSPDPSPDTIDKQGDELEALRADLNTVKPVPADVRAAHDQVEASIAAAAQAVHRAADVARGKDPEDIAGAARSVDVATAGYRAAVDALNGRLK